MKKIITLSGSAQHGKDTAANFMKKYLPNSITVAYADYLKFVCGKYFGYKGDEFKADPEQRYILQYYGTEIGRKTTIWVDVVKSFVNTFGDLFDYIILTDCRFPNEIEAFDDVTSVKIIRPNFNNGLNNLNNHISETALKDYTFTYTIYNSGTLEDFDEEIKDLCELIVR